MDTRSSRLANLALALIVLVLLAGEAYILSLKRALGGNRMATLGTCKQDGLSATGLKEAPQKDVYVNCSGFHG